MTKPGIVKSEIVTFNGMTFRRYPESNNLTDRKYFKPVSRWRALGVEALHREVWKAHHGAIPDGYHVHHKDGNTGNNAIENLELLPGLEHLKMHGEKMPAEQREQLRQRINRVREKASEWHKSDEGRVWHVEHGKEVWAKREPITCKCEECGKEFETLARHGKTRFCSGRCKQKNQYHNMSDRGLTKTQVCQYCGKQYEVYKHEDRQKFCSMSCGAKARWAARKAKAESE